MPKPQPLLNWFEKKSSLGEFLMLIPSSQEKQRFTTNQCAWGLNALRKLIKACWTFWKSLLHTLLLYKFTIWPRPKCSVHMALLYRLSPERTKVTILVSHQKTFFFYVGVICRLVQYPVFYVYGLLKGKCLVASCLLSWPQTFRIY